MKTFTLASLNICSAHFMQGHYTEQNLLLLANEIKSSGADIIALQEVDVGAARSARVDMPAMLAKLTGLEHHYFIKIRDFEGGEYGTALLSRYAILDSGTFDYPVKLAKQGTSCGYCVFNVEGIPVSVFNTHLSVESDAANTETLCCLADILNAYRRSHKDGFLVCGDFNTGVEKIQKHLPWLARAHDGLITYGNVSIDHILHTENIKTADVRTVNTQHDRITDHNMLLCKVSVE